MLVYHVPGRWKYFKADQREEHAHSSSSCNTKTGTFIEIYRDHDSRVQRFGDYALVYNLHGTEVLTLPGQLSALF